MRTLCLALLLVSPLLPQGTPSLPQAVSPSYYRDPAIHQDTIVFSAEGDLWQVSREGGIARRLTTHPGEEVSPAFSPDGSTIAFSADYEGPTEVYTMPAGGGLPVRRTYEGQYALVAGWTPDGKVLYATRRYAALPDTQLATIDGKNRIELIPLSQAAQGTFDPEGKTLFFTRLPFQGSSTKRYQGGTAEKLWKFALGSPEAIPLTADYKGISKAAMWWRNRVYFASDRDGTMNLWSMDAQGKDLKQHTHHKGWDIQSPALGDGRIVYQAGADLWLFDIASGKDRVLPIQLPSDFDHLRERWIRNPMDYLTSLHLSPDGSKVVLTARGNVFVAPAAQGRFVDATYERGHRFRDARMLPDGKNLLVLSTETGEIELWKIPANGVGKAEELTSDGHVLRWDAVPSPDGKWIVHHDKDLQLWLLNTETKVQKRIAVAALESVGDGGFADIRWSPDSRWFTYTAQADNDFSQVVLFNVEQSKSTPLTSDRFNSFSACWSADGKWLYFLSDRELRTLIPSPWGPRQPDPYFDRAVKIYELALRKGQRSPFQPADELHDTPAKPEEPPKPSTPGQTPPPPRVEIDLDAIATRIAAVPAPPGNYHALSTNGTRLFWRDVDRAHPMAGVLMAMDVTNKKPKPERLLEDLRGYELSENGKKLLIRKGSDIFVLDATVKEEAMKSPKLLDDGKVDLKNWTFPVVPMEEFREAFLDAWRMERDYFYDRNMNGVDWMAMREKYRPLVERVRSRAELNDLVAQMVSELSALHIFVFGGDLRRGTDQVQVASLGARLVRDDAAGGFRIEHIYRTDPDLPEKLSPLARPGVDVHDGDVLTRINGVDVLSIGDPMSLLRNSVDKQVLLHVKPKGTSETRPVVVVPISAQQEADLRYSEWEYTRRLAVDRLSDGQIGYVHLRAMGPGDIAQWVRDYYPVYNRAGLIIDVRHNGGGNIDSWLLGKLLRKAWFYWQPRVGKPFWNMQYAFRGHMVVLCDERTGSDGEAFAEGFRRLDLGKVIGTRTWGGEIWLSMSNVLADKGIASAAEMGVYGPEGKWLIEGHGVDPDVVVDNLPHATFNGQDAQLEAGVQYLKKLIRDQPNPVPAPPPYPRKGI
jgi:tricorn protease